MPSIHRIAFATVLLFSASCTPTIPVADGSTGYEIAAFKDDAPANTEVGDFPQSFVDSEGRAVDLAAYRGSKVVLVVLRGVPQSLGGAFCPHCLAQVSSLMGHRQELEERAARVLVLFPGPSERLGEFVETARRQTSGEPKFTFQLLLDQDLKTCDRLGIRADLAKPSTYILDTRGKMTYAYVGETTVDRPSIKAILNQLDRAK